MEGRITRIIKMPMYPDRRDDSLFTLMLVYRMNPAKGEMRYHYNITNAELHYLFDWTHLWWVAPSCSYLSNNASANVIA